MTIHYNYPGINMAAGDLTAATSAERAEVEGVKAVMASLAPVWGGKGSEAYKAVQISLDRQYAEAAAASADLARRLAEAGGSMAVTDGGVGGYF